MNPVEVIFTDIKTKIDLDDVIKIYGLNYQDEYGNSFLHHFARKGNIELLVYLFDKKHIEKCDINLKDNNQRTALFDALNEEIVEFLLLQRIDYEAKDIQGKKAEEVNGFVNFIINQKCNELKKKIMKNLFR